MTDATQEPANDDGVICRFRARLTTVPMTYILSATSMLMEPGSEDHAWALIYENNIQHITGQLLGGETPCIICETILNSENTFDGLVVTFVDDDEFANWKNDGDTVTSHTGAVCSRCATSRSGDEIAKIASDDFATSQADAIGEVAGHA